MVLATKNTPEEALASGRRSPPLSNQQPLQSLRSPYLLTTLPFKGAGCSVDEMSERVGQCSPSAATDGGCDLSVVSIGARIEVVDGQA